MIGASPHGAERKGSNKKGTPELKALLLKTLPKLQRISPNTTLLPSPKVRENQYLYPFKKVNLNDKQHTTRAAP